MATNPGFRKPRYCPVQLAPPPGKLNQPLNECETPQLKEMPYRGSMKIGHAPTYKNTKPKADRRKGDV